MLYTLSFIQDKIKNETLCFLEPFLTEHRYNCCSVYQFRNNQSLDYSLGGNVRLTGEMGNYTDIDLTLIPEPCFKR